MKNVLYFSKLCLRKIAFVVNTTARGVSSWVAAQTKNHHAHGAASQLNIKSLQAGETACFGAEEIR